MNNWTNPITSTVLEPEERGVTGVKREGRDRTTLRQSGNALQSRDGIARTSGDAQGIGAGQNILAASTIPFVNEALYTLPCRSLHVSCF